MTMSTFQAKALCVVGSSKPDYLPRPGDSESLHISNWGSEKSLTLCWHARTLPGVGHIQFPLISYVTNFSTAYLVASLDISPEYYVTTEV